MGVTALRWWSDAQLARLAPRFESAAALWSGAWGIAGPVAVECRRAHEGIGIGDGAPVWLPLGQEAGNGRQAWLRAAPDLEPRLFAAMFGPRATRASAVEPATLADQLADRAWRDLQEALRPVCMLAGASAGQPTSHDAQFPAHAWSGALAIAITCGPLEIALRVSPRCASAMMAAIDAPAAHATAAPVPALASLTSALKKRALQVRATLPRLELELGSLQALAVGDVIRLPHLLDQPLTVHVDGDEAVLCAAYLGQLKGRRAVELVRPAPADLHIPQEIP